MDMVKIEPQMLCGRVTAPPSKSAAHRAVISAALSGGSCLVTNLAFSRDIEATLGCMRALGASVRVSREKGRTVFSPPREKALPEKLTLNCEESGSTLRFLMPVALNTGRKVRFIGKGRLMQRPQKPYFDLFEKKGVRVETGPDYIELEGKLEPGDYKIPGNISSQFITGLLFALPQLAGDSEIQMTAPLESKGYVDMTLAVLEDFGIQVENQNYQRFFVPGGQRFKARDYQIEGDYSQAAFFLTAGALGCDIVCGGLRPDSLQGDKKILEILNEAGAEVEFLPGNDIRVRRTDRLHGLMIDAREIPDLVPILAVLCAFCPGESRIVNAGRLRMKESDRLAAVCSELGRLGLKIEEGTDFLRICGTEVLYGETVSSWRDHRIAMALSIAACRCEGPVLITGAEEAVQKSYPDFFSVYAGLQKGPAPVVRYGETITENQTRGEKR